MPMLKRMFLLLFALTALFLFGQTVSAAGSDGFSIAVETTKTPVQGENFTIDVELSDNPGITGLDLTLSYDRSVMTLQSAQFADFLTGHSGIQCSRNGNSLKVTSDSPIGRSGVWVRLTFLLGENVGMGNYPIGISGSASGTGGALRPTLVAGGVNLDCLHDYYATETTKPTCSSEGYTVYRCRECSITYISDYVDKLPHTWGSSSTENATCTRPATLTHTCRVCGQSETVETSPALGHHYVESVVEPTCTKEGYTLYQCSRCDESYHGDVLPKVDHRYTKTYSKPATCSDTGYDLYSCVFCGLSYQQTVPTLEHSWQTERIEPTHTHGGWTLYTCSACGLSMRGDFTDPLVYNYEYTVETEPGCTTPGVRIGVCTDGCGHTVREEIPPTGHSFGEWEQIRTATLYRTGRWKNVCTVCGFEVESSTPKLIADDSEPSPAERLLSADFWLGVLARMRDNLLTTLLIACVIVMLFLLILLRKIFRVSRYRHDPSLTELELIAEGVERLSPTWNAPPDPPENPSSCDGSSEAPPPEESPSDGPSSGNLPDSPDPSDSPDAPPKTLTDGAKPTDPAVVEEVTSIQGKSDPE